MPAATLYNNKKGCAKKAKFSPEEKTKQDTIKIMAKIILEMIIDFMRFRKSVFALKKLFCIHLIDGTCHFKNWKIHCDNKTSHNHPKKNKHNRLNGICQIFNGLINFIVIKISNFFHHCIKGTG